MALAALCFALFWVGAPAVSGCNRSSTNSSPDMGLAVDLRQSPLPVSCRAQGGSSPVQKPRLVRTIPGTGTSWFGGAAVVDLDNDGKRELVGAFYDLWVWDAGGKRLARAKTGGSHSGRIYAPAVVADLDGDKVTEVVVGAGKGVAAYEYKKGALTIKAGWPVTAGRASDSYEVRGLAAADLDNDGALEVVASTTVGKSGSQVWVFSASGKLYQPAGITWPAWPRFNTRTGTGGDADENGAGITGYGCYGLNIGIGDIDDDPQQEIIVTNDTHRIMAFEHDGRSKAASGWFSNPTTRWLGKPMAWAQFIRWADPDVERDLYHLHKGNWPNVGDGDVWLQWTQSPPNVVDINGDGKNEVLAVANAESGIPYKTVYNAFVVLEGQYGAGDRSGRRLPGWEKLPRGKAPQARPSGWYPPLGLPSPTSVDLDGDRLPETIVPSEDGHVHVVSPNARLLWSHDIRAAGALTYASEVTVADLNRDGRPELLLSAYGKPDHPNAGRLIILDGAGRKLFDITVPNQGKNGNGVGLPAAPAVGDLDGDGALEIVLQSFDHGLDIYTVPGSGAACLPWPVARGNLLRNGQGPSYQPAR